MYVREDLRSPLSYPRVPQYSAYTLSFRKDNLRDSGHKLVDAEGVSWCPSTMGIESFNEVLPKDLDVRMPIRGPHGESVVIVEVPLAPSALERAGYNTDVEFIRVRVAYDFETGRLLQVDPETDFVESAVAGAWSFDTEGFLALLVAGADGAGGYTTTADEGFDEWRYLLKLHGAKLDIDPVLGSYDPEAARALLAKVSVRDLWALAGRITNCLVTSVGGCTSTGNSLATCVTLMYHESKSGIRSITALYRGNLSEGAAEEAIRRDFSEIGNAETTSVDIELVEGDRLDQFTDGLGLSLRDP